MRRRETEEVGVFSRADVVGFWAVLVIVGVLIVVGAVRTAHWLSLAVSP